MSAGHCGTGWVLTAPSLPLLRWVKGDRWLPFPESQLLHLGNGEDSTRSCLLHKAFERVMGVTGKSAPGKAKIITE